jgi:hypothetical protein
MGGFRIDPAKSQSTNEAVPVTKGNLNTVLFITEDFVTVLQYEIDNLLSLFTIIVIRKIDFSKEIYQRLVQD